ncbi:hypothetical protein BaRGS_00038051 [Batillaria attramentaria]|uniref:Uncharacterized protein n=1 Tax=Batillaria attramentaria TaxID=370345 RepID=A0ABD0J7S5_9CAEN
MSLSGVIPAVSEKNPAHKPPHRTGYSLSEMHLLHLHMAAKSGIKILVTKWESCILDTTIDVLCPVALETNGVGDVVGRPEPVATALDGDGEADKLKLHARSRVRLCGRS